MSDTVKIIIEIDKDKYERCKERKLWSYDAEILEGAVAMGIPLDSVKAEIKRMEYHMIDCDVLVSQEEVLDILDNIGKAESEGE